MIITDNIFALALGKVEDQFTDQETVDADLAISDAVNFLKYIDADQEPFINVSDEGVVFVQWRNAEVGVVLLFSGDGIASLSIRDNNHSYTDNVLDLEINSIAYSKINEVLKII